MDRLSTIPDLEIKHLNSPPKNEEKKKGNVQSTGQIRSKSGLEDSMIPQIPNGHSNSLELGFGKDGNRAHRPRSMPVCDQDWMELLTKDEEEADRSKWVPTSRSSPLVGHRTLDMLTYCTHRMGG